VEASIGRGVAHEHDALDDAAMAFQQEDPIISPLEFRLRADLCAGLAFWNLFLLRYMLISCFSYLQS
jgi:hypothetical protein